MDAARRRRRRRGVTLIFVVVTLPMFFFGIAIATDATLMIVRARAVGNAANAAAVAGARQTNPATGKLVVADARNMAIASMRLDQTHGVLQGVTVSGLSAKTVSSPYGEAVRVTARYRIPRLLVTPIVNLFTKGTARSPEFTITRTAFVCDPNRTNNPTASCTRATR